MGAPQCTFGGSLLTGHNPYGRLSTIRADAVLWRDAVILEHSYCTAPFKLLPPHPLPGGGARVTQLSVSAGIMAGDRQEIHLNIGMGARVVWTTQSYEKIHKMPPGAWAERNCRIVLEGGSFLDYSPLPVIPFADSDYRAATCIDMMDTDASLVYREIFCAGRIAQGELFRFRRYRQLLELRLGGCLLFRENTDLRPSEQGEDAPLDGMGFFEGHSHFLTMVFRIPGLNQEEIRQKLHLRSSITAALTALEDGAFLVRALGHSAEELQNLGEELVF